LWGPLARERKVDSEGEQLRRVRRICLGFPETSEKLSHGEPTFFTNKKVFAMFSNNHHDDGHVAVCVPAAPGLQELLTQTAPEKFYRPPYVGVRGWIGIELDEVDDAELALYLSDAWRLIGKKQVPQRARR
jgi:hypothetical protein